jgi:acyl-coenzyme A synthetase/AMP-(fatty) acid ligase
VLPPAVVLDPKRFVTAITHHSVTILWMTVGLLAQYVDELGRALRALRYLITGGDVVEAHLVARIFKNGAPEHLLNAYGPTECTTFSTSFLIESPHSDTGRVPIGRPISNTRVYILDSMQQPVPVGVTGEIYIGGPGVAAGYLNRPETDAARFLADPFDGSSSGRLYRTGDLGRWRADGNIEFLGRNDRQVKLRGFRVEPGEIEARLLESPLVKEAAVVTRRDAQEDKQLVAYITAAPDTVAAEKELAVTLHRHLAAVLPHFMVPSVFVLLGTLCLLLTKPRMHPMDMKRLGVKWRCQWLRSGRTCLEFSGLDDQMTSSR